MGYGFIRNFDVGCVENDLCNLGLGFSLGESVAESMRKRELMYFLTGVSGIESLPSRNFDNGLKCGLERN